MRKLFIPSLIPLLIYVNVNVAFPRHNYSALRNEILEYEQRLMVGANLMLNEAERVANEILTGARNEELQAGFENPQLFAPARNFIEAKEDIEKSKVFKLLRSMPKGAVLHAHDTSLVSSDYIYHNITFRDDLYVCIVDSVVKLRFFRVPDQTSCNWTMLKNIREDPEQGEIVNKMIQKRLSMKVNDTAAAYPNVDKAWTKFDDIFAFIDPLVTYRPVYEDYFIEALEQLYQDNVMYLELRSTLPTLYDFEGTRYLPEDIIGIYERLAERFKKEHPDFIGVKMIYAPVRSNTRQRTEENIKTMKLLKKKYPKFMAGFDLVGQEEKGHTLKYFADILTKNEEENINFFFHAGETKWLGTSTDENLVDAILLNTKRIGHGYALDSHPFLLELTKQLDIAIEINPISNQVLKLVDDLRNHAARRLFSEGYPVVISNDDPGCWGSRALSYDFYEAFMALMSKHADLRSLKQVALNSLHYSSLSNLEKEKALELWQAKWDAFVENVVRDNY